MGDSGRDAKFFQRGKAGELRAELQADGKDKGWVKKKAALKKVIANATMGNDMSSLFPDMVNCMNIQVLDIKKMVCECLILVCLMCALCAKPRCIPQTCTSSITGALGRISFTRPFRAFLQ
jgi:hypothetical protein